MAEIRSKLQNPPVREALIDIRFEPEIDMTVIDRFGGAIASRYPKQSNISLAQIDIRGDQAPAVASHTSGRRYDMTDGTFVVQCQGGAMTVSRLSPYVDWEELLAEAKTLWEQLRALVQVHRVTRVAVRYINAIAMPLPLKDFAEYLTCPPQVPKDGPQGISGYLQRVVIPLAEISGNAVIMQALEDQNAAAEGLVTVVLDIDVSRPVDFNGADTNSLWSCLSSLRDQKNKLFFAHLTEMAVERYI